MQNLSYEEIEILQSTMLHYPSESKKYRPGWNKLANKLIRFKAETAKPVELGKIERAFFEDDQL
jgi:hypothetical protein